MGFIQAHGGLVGSVLVVLLCYNVIMSGIAKMFSILGAQEPVALQKAGDIGLKITQLLSANTPTPDKKPEDSNG